MLIQIKVADDNATGSTMKSGTQSNGIIVGYETVETVDISTSINSVSSYPAYGKRSREKGCARLCLVARDCRFAQQKYAAFSRVSACSRRVSTSLYNEQRMDSLGTCVLSSLRLLGYKQREFGGYSMGNIRPESSRTL